MAAIKMDSSGISYVDTVQGDKTLVFVHGSFIDKDYWEAQINHFQKNFRVIAPDLPGHGKSSRKLHNWTVQEYGEDLAAFLNRLNLDDVILIGHSMGGDVVLEAAVRRPGPVSGIIGVETLKNAGTELPEEVQRQGNQLIAQLKIDFSGTSAFYAQQVLLTPRTPANVGDRVIHDYRNFDPEPGIPTTLSFFNYSARERWILDRLDFALHLINADYFPTNEKALGHYAKHGYSLSILKCSSHFPMLETPAELNRALDKQIMAIIEE